MGVLALLRSGVRDGEKTKLSIEDTQAFTKYSIHPSASGGDFLPRPGSSPPAGSFSPPTPPDPALLRKEPEKGADRCPTCP